MKTNLEKLKDLHSAFKDAGYDYTQKAFAEFLGINEGNLSAILKGRIPTTETFLYKVEKQLRAAGVPLPMLDAPSTIPAPAAEPSDPIHRLLDEIAAQREMYDRHMTDMLALLKDAKGGNVSRPYEPANKAAFGA